MIKSSLSEFASQSGSGGKEEPSQDIETSQDREPSPDCTDPSEGKEGELSSDHEDPDLVQGDPNIGQFMLTEGEQGDFDTFALAWLSVFLQKGRKGKTPLWKVSQENPNFYSKAQQAHQQATPTFTNQCLAYKISGSAPQLLRFLFMVRLKLKISSPN